MKSSNKNKPIRKENIELLKKKYISGLSPQQLKILENAKNIFTNFEIERSNGFLNWLNNNNINTI
jgi:hypothetical protein